MAPTTDTPNNTKRATARRSSSNSSIGSNNSDNSDGSVLEMLEEKRRLAEHRPSSSPAPSAAAAASRSISTNSNHRRLHPPPRKSPAAAATTKTTTTTAKVPGMKSSNSQKKLDDDDDGDMSVLEIIEEKRWLARQQTQQPQPQQQQQQPQQQQQQQQRRPLPSCRIDRPLAATATATATTAAGPAKTSAAIRTSSDSSALAVMPGAIAVRGSSAIYDDSDSDEDESESEKPSFVGQRHSSFRYSAKQSAGAVDDSAGDVAIAVEVDEQEEEEAAKKMVQSVAVEFDPDAKPPRPPLAKSKLFRRSALILLIATLCIGAAATAGILLSVNNRAESDQRLYRESLGIREEIEKVIGAEHLESESSSSSSESPPQLSPYAKAMEWIIHQDPMQLVPGDANLLQRYITAYLYFSTTTKGPWRSCNPPVDGSNEQNFCYHSLMTAIDYTHKDQFYESIPANRWLTPLHECQFAGVACDEDMQIRELRLSGANMSGSFPTGIVHLTFLQVIEFGDGTLTGPLPKELAALKDLTEIELCMNEFIGEIPIDWWSNLNKISRLDLSFNQIEGTISSQVRKMTMLDSLALVGNKLRGPIPTELYNLSNLEKLRLRQNDLTGPIPTEIGQALKLEDLWLDQNLLTGTIPTEIGTMDKLVDFTISKNPRLGGTIPDEFYGLKKLQFVEMFSCNFTGPLSPQIGTMKLEFLKFNDNSFTGTLPEVLADLQNLVYLEVQDNNFQGKMPEGLCKQVHIADGSTEMVPAGLQILAADCAPDPSTGAVQLKCDCCTKCCTANHCV